MLIDTKRIDAFLYLLLRDTPVACGEIERIVQQAEAIDVFENEIVFSNKYLKGYAQNIRIRLSDDTSKS